MIWTVRLWGDDLVVGYSSLRALVCGLIAAYRELVKIGDRDEKMPRLRIVRIGER